MALTWDLTKINNYEDICWVKDSDNEDNVTLSSETESLIWLTMAVGIGKITESNAQEFYSRVHTYETLFGAFRVSFDNDTNEKKYHFITPEAVVNHIGLHTNVSLETAASFKKRIFDNFIRESNTVFKNHISKKSDD